MALIGMDDLGEIIKKYQDGATIPLFVTPNCRSCIFPAGFNEWKNRIKIKVKAKAQDNKANKDVLKTIAEYFNTKLKNVYIVSGEKSKEKTVFVKGGSVEFISNKLMESINGIE
jgi:hypothetical protein